MFFMLPGRFTEYTDFSPLAQHAQQVVHMRGTRTKETSTARGIIYGVRPAFGWGEAHLCAKGRWV